MGFSRNFSSKAPHSAVIPLLQHSGAAPTRTHMSWTWHITTHLHRLVLHDLCYFYQAKHLACLLLSSHAKLSAQHSNKRIAHEQPFSFRHRLMAQLAEFHRFRQRTTHSALPSSLHFIIGPCGMQPSTRARPPAGSDRRTRPRTGHLPQSREPAPRTGDRSGGCLRAVRRGLPFYP